MAAEYPRWKRLSGALGVSWESCKKRGLLEKVGDWISPKSTVERNAVKQWGAEAYLK